MVAARHPLMQTEDELAILFATRCNLAVNAEQLRQVIAAINASKPVEVVVSPEPVKIVVAAEPEVFELDEPVVEPVVAPVIEAEPGPVADPEPGLDPADYATIGVGSSELEPLRVTTNSQGLREVSWSPIEGAVFVVAAGQKGFPDSLKSDRDDVQVFKPTIANSLTFSSENRYVSVFSFGEAGLPGKKVGEGRALGRLTRFDVEKYPGRIILTWETDDPEATVVIHRSEPNQKLSSSPISEPERKPASSFLNQVLDIGDSYEYRAHLEWQSNEGSPVDSAESEALTLQVVVPGAVPKIEDFWVQRNPGEDEVVIRVNELAKKGLTLDIYQNSGDPGNALVARGNTQFTLEEFEDRLFQSQVGTKVNQEAEIAEGVRTLRNVPLIRDADGVTASTITYTAVARLGNDVFISKPFVLQIVDDLEVLGLEDFFDYHLMRLEVPTGATEFEVWVTDIDKKFEDVVELNPSRKFNRETHYDLFGGLRFENTDLPVTPRKIFVRGTSAFFDGQNNAGQHREFIYPGRVTVRYRLKNEAPIVEPKKSGLFKGKSEPVAAPTPKKVEVWVDYPEFGINAKNERVSLLSLQLLQLAAPAPAFAMIKHDRSSNYTKAKAKLNLVDFDANGTYKEVTDELGNPILTDPSGENRYIAYFADSENILTKVFVINDDKDTAMNGNGLDKPGRPQCLANPNRKLKIAIIGAKASGKTTYVSALLQYLEHQFGPSFGGRLAPKPGDAKALERSSQLANFVRSGIALDATDTAVNFLDSPVGASVADPRTKFTYKMLISATSPVGEFEFLDVAGEDLATVETMDYYRDALQEADLIIFLFDPLQLPEVRNLLVGMMALPPSNAASPAVIWENLKEVAGPIGSRKNPNQKVAVTMSKFDALTLAMSSGNFAFSEALDSAMALNRDPYASNPSQPSPGASKDFNRLDGAAVSAETKALLRLVGLSVEADLDKDPNGWGELNVGYFSVSALGQGVKGRTHGISSFRIGDPIRWALANQS